MTLTNVHFVLDHPRSAANVGAVARVIKNFGLGRMVIVGSLAHRSDEAEKLAHGSEDVLEQARIVGDLDEALAETIDAVASTGRACDSRTLSPSEAAARLVRRAQAGPVALVLGTEKTGLDNRTLARFDAVTTIPTASAKRSLNLAQSAAIFGYELRLAVTPPSNSPAEPRAPHALIAQLRTKARPSLLAADFLNPRQPNDAVLDELIRLLLRAEPSSREVELLLGALTALTRITK